MPEDQEFRKQGIMFQSRCLQNIKTNCNLLKNDPVNKVFI